MNISNTRQTLAILLVSIGIFYFDTLKWLIVSWTNNAYYSHGFFIPIISGYLIWNMRKDLENIEKKHSHEGLIIFIVGIVMYGIGSLMTIRFISGLSLIVTISGLILYLYGWKFINKIKFPLLFLIFMIPLPIIDLAAPPVQTIAAAGSVKLANIVGIPVTRDGLLLNLPTGSLEVAIECSGLNSIISLMALSCIFAFILDFGLIKKSIIFTSSIPIAMISNILRITSVLAIGNKYGIEVATGYFHSFSSLLLFSIALVGIYLVGRSFGRLNFRKTF